MTELSLILKIVSNFGVISGIRKEHNQHVEWLKSCREQFENVSSMEKVEINQEMVKMQCRKMPNWKALGKDGVQGYWLKNLTSLHPHIAVQLNQILDGERKVHPLTRLDDLWKGSTVPKRPGKKKCS